MIAKTLFSGDSPLALEATLEEVETKFDQWCEKQAEKTGEPLSSVKANANQHVLAHLREEGSLPSEIPFGPIDMLRAIAGEMLALAAEEGILPEPPRPLTTELKK